MRASWLRSGLATLILALPAPLVADSLVLYVTGQGQLIRGMQDMGPPAGLAFQADDSLRVPLGGQAKAILADGTVVQLWEDAELRLVRADTGRAAGPRSVELELVRGNARVIAGSLPARATVWIRTPSARVEFGRGADAVIRHNQAGDFSEVVAVRGPVVVDHLFEDFPGTATLDTQQTSIVTLESPPSRPVFVDRAAFASLRTELAWTAPTPVPQWRERLDSSLERLGASTYSRLRREAAKPLQPLHSVNEEMLERRRGHRPGEAGPVPRSRLGVEFELLEEP